MRHRRQGLLSRLVKRIREKVGIKTVLVRDKEPLEWDDRDAHTIRWLLRTPTGQKLITMMDDAILCAYLDLKPRPYCAGMASLRDFVLSLQGQEPPKVDQVGDSQMEGEDWATMPMDLSLEE